MKLQQRISIALLIILFLGFYMVSVPVRAQTNASSLLYSTVVGGGDFENAADIVYSNGHAYVVGMTYSLPLDFFNSSVRRTYGSCSVSSANIYVAKFVLAGNGLGDLVYATVVCGSDYDEAIALVVSASGNVYVGGNTQSTDFYNMAGKSGGFVLLLNADGSFNKIAALGTADAVLQNVAIDSVENLYVVGQATANSAIQTTSGAYDTTFNGGYDIFAMKFNSSLTKLYATYIGTPSYQESAYGLAVDSQGNLIVTGETDSSTFPVKGTLDQTYNGGTADVFVLKLKPSGGGSSDLVYSFYLGGSGWDLGTSVVVDSNNDLVLVGQTDSSSFPLAGAFDTVTQGSKDIFVTKINAGGTALVFSTFLGGSNTESYPAVALGQNGDAIVTGRTASTDFPVYGGFQSTGKGFLARIDLAGAKLAYATYLADNGNSVAADGSGNAYVAGDALAGFPTTTGAYDQTHAGSTDGFVIKVDVRNLVTPPTSTFTPTPTGTPVPPPVKPVLSPIDNLTCSKSYPVSWGDVNGRSYFELQEDNSLSFSNPALRYTGPDLQWIASSKPVGQYFYRVRACAAGGSCSEWSASQTVTVADRPAEAIILGPQNDSMIYYPDKVIVSWEAANNATSYEIIAYQTSYLSPEISETYASATPPAGGYAIRDLAGRLGDGLWDVRVRGLNSCGQAGSWSAPRYLRYYNTHLEAPEFLNFDDVYNRSGQFTITWKGVLGLNPVYELRRQRSGETQATLIYRGENQSFVYDLAQSGAGVFDFSLMACRQDPDDPSVSRLCGAPTYKMGVVILDKPELTIQNKSRDGKSWQVARNTVAGADQYWLTTDNSETGEFDQRIDFTQVTYIQETNKLPGIYHYQLSACKGSVCRVEPNDIITVIVMGGVPSDQPLEGIWLSQLPRPNNGDYTTVHPGETLIVTIVTQQLGTLPLTNQPGYGQVIISVTKTPSRISAPASTGYDDCFNGPGGTFGNPGPNCGKSYLRDPQSWLSIYHAATSVETSIAPQGGIMTIRLRLKIPADAETAKLMEGFTFYVNMGSEANPDWQPIKNHINGENDTLFVWVGLDIQSDLILDTASQSFPGEDNPIPVPQKGDVKDIKATFKAVNLPTNASGLKLCLRKDPASSPPSDNSYFRHANWLAFNQVVEGEMVSWCSPAAFQKSDANYTVLVDFSGNNTLMSACTLGQYHTYCREDFGVVYQINGVYKWARSLAGRVISANRQDANVWWNILVVPDFLGEFQYQQHTDLPLSPLLVTQTGCTVSTVVVKNVGGMAWKRDEVLMGLKNLAEQSPFASPDWLENGYVARMEGPGPILPGQEAVFHVSLCGNNQALRQWDSPDDYRAHFLLYHNGVPIAASKKGNQDGQVEYWVPISVVEKPMAKCSIVSPKIGSAFTTTVSIDVRCSSTGEIMGKTVVLKYLGVPPSGSRGEWMPVTTWAVQPGQYQFTYTWDISQFPDQPDIELGVELIDSTDNIHKNTWCDRVVIAKDTSGYKLKLVRASGTPVTLTGNGDRAYRVNAIADTSIALDAVVVTEGSKTLSASGEDHVGLYIDDQPVGLCPCNCGRAAPNYGTKFRFVNPLFASIPGNPETGVAHALEGDLSVGQQGTYRVTLQVPATPGIYWLDLGWAHAEHWIFDGEVNNGCDSHARVTFMIVVYPKEIVRYMPGGRQPNSPTVGDPVDPYSGNYTATFNWIKIQDRLSDLTLGATYNAISPVEGILGWGWNFEYDWRLIFDGEGRVTVQNGSARKDTYTDPDGDGQYISPPAIHQTLSRKTDGTYILRFLDASEYHFDVAGQLVEMVDRNQNKAAFFYNDIGLLQKIVDRSGRSYNLRYNLNETRLTTIELPDGNRWRFGYDSVTGDLLTVTDPDDQHKTYVYNSDHRLFTLSDQNDHVVLENHYDTQGRVIWQKSMDNIATFRYVYQGDGSGYTVMTDGRSQDWTYVFNSHGWITEERDPQQQSILYAYDQNGYRASQTNKRGFTTLFEHDRVGNVLKITNPLLAQRLFTFDPTFNTLLQETDYLGRKTVYALDPKGNIQLATAPNGGQTHYERGDWGQVVSIQDAEGGVKRYSYDQWGNVNAITDALGNVTRMQFDIMGRLIKKWDPLNALTVYEYDKLGRLIKEIDPLQRVVRHEYDPVGNLKTVIDPSGTTRYFYDAKDRLVQIMDARGYSTFYGYDPNNNRIWMKDALNALWVYEYDELNRLIIERDPAGYELRYEYDVNGNRTRVIAPDLRSTTRVYDELDRITQIIEPGNRITQSVYDAVGNVIQIIDPMNRVTRKQYNPIDALIAVTDTLQSSVHYTVNLLGQRIEMLDANQHLTTWERDAAGNVVRMIDPDQRVTTTEYNALGLPSRLVDANQKITQFEYNLSGQLITKSAPEGTVRWERDFAGNPVVMTDTTGITQQVFDATGNLTTYTAPGQKTVNYERDALGRVKCITYPGGDPVCYDYTLNNRLSRITDWAGRVITYETNPAGQVLKQILPNEVTILTTYDEHGWPEQITHKAKDGEILTDIVYTYNALGDIETTQELIKAVGNTTLQNKSLALNAGWSLFSLPLQPVEPVFTETICSSQTAIREIARWKNGNWDSHLCATQWNDFALEIGRSYFVRSADPVTIPMTGYTLPGEPLPLALKIGWNDFSNTSGLTTAGAACQHLAARGANIAEIARWVNGAWSSHICGTGLNNFTLENGQALLIRSNTAVQLTGQPPVLSVDPLVNGTTHYEYDNARRLTAVIYPNGDRVEYVYDPMGNRTQMTANGQELDYQYSSSDCLLRAGNTTFTCDNAGRMTGRTENGTTTAYLFDTDGYPTRIGNVVYLYNGAHQKVSETVNNQSTTYVYDTSGDLPRILVESSPNGDVRYIYGTGLAARVGPNDQVSYYHTDHLGSVRALTDNSGKLVASYAYDAFGALRLSSGTPSTFGFTGEQTNSDLELINLRSRIYDPELGRFITRDVFGGYSSDVQSLNRYSYARNNPLLFTDPSGNFFEMTTDSEFYKMTEWVDGPIGQGLRYAATELAASSIGALVGIASLPFVGPAAPVASATAASIVRSSLNCMGFCLPTLEDYAQDVTVGLIVDKLPVEPFVHSFAKGTSAGIYKLAIEEVISRIVIPAFLDPSPVMAPGAESESFFQPSLSEGFFQPSVSSQGDIK